MQSREDGKHMNLNELYDSNIFDLMESQYRILAKIEQKQKEEQLNQLDTFFDTN
ncbi:hypothetical protein [Macrococcoides caseolyticum]|uniref:hypothetical protein n=1 Tax=Macrococcoides caseolyticum TaxID=69966 RepID=UPI001F1BBCA3|nr:hypothetical protein [Macrococcus caseolyticus]MCE4957253.1 hypothetical protein [Macrococcus caseolyticus]